MRTLIIGTGMVGSHVAKELSRNNHQVIMVGYNPDISYIQKVIEIEKDNILNMYINDEKELKEIIDSYRITNIVICAGMMIRQFEHYSGASILNEANLLLSIYNTCMQTNHIKKVLYISSLGVYGEELHEESKTPQPKSIYGAVKYYNETILQKLHQNSGIAVGVIRSFGVLGPCHEKSGNWLSNLVRNVYYSDYTVRIDITENAHPINFVDVRDLSSAVNNIYGKINSYDVINIGNKESYSIDSFVNVMTECFHKKVIVNHSNVKHDHAGNYHSVTEKAEGEYQFTPQYKIVDSIDMIGEFYSGDR